MKIQFGITVDTKYTAGQLKKRDTKFTER